MNTVTQFMNTNFGALTAIGIEGVGWFIGKEIVQKLGYDLTTTSYIKYISRYCMKEDVISYDKETQSRYEIEFDYKNLGQRGGLLINEYAIYDLVSKSPLPAAKQFHRWITHEVLPQIRMYGGYIPGNSGPEVIANGMGVMDNKVGLKNNTEYIKAYIEKNEREIQEREPQFRLHPYNPVRFVVLGNFIGWGVYKQITMERLYEVMYKIRFIFDNDNITYLNPAKVYRLSKHKDEILLTPAGFEELYYYFSDSKLKRRFKDVDYDELRLEGERAAAERKTMQNIVDDINKNPDKMFKYK